MIELAINWTISPEIIEGMRVPRWYSLLFAGGFVLGYQIMKRIFDHEKEPIKNLEKLLIYVMVGTIVGARLGHVFFYDWAEYKDNLIDIFKIWEGGLASHGGAIGILIALFLYQRKINRSFLWVLDRVVIPVMVGGICIRLGNLMNHEIVGKESTVAWAFKFAYHDQSIWTTCHSCMAEIGNHCVETDVIDKVKYCVDMNKVPSRHPAQLYEAISYVFVFLGLFFMYWKTKIAQKPGVLFGTFLAGVFTARFIIEYVKVSQGGFEKDLGASLSTGQWLSIPFVMVGLLFIVIGFLSNKTEKKTRD